MSEVCRVFRVLELFKFNEDGILGMVKLSNYSSFAEGFVCLFVCTVVLLYLPVWSLGVMQIQRTNNQYNPSVKMSCIF